MSAATIAAIISASAAVLQVGVFAAGYYILYKIYQRQTTHMERQRTANGRPQVIVTDHYGGLPDVSVTVRNYGDGAARNIEFDFSAPVESSDGVIVSNLAYFRHGMASLVPGGRVTAYWDRLENIIPILKNRGLDTGIVVTTRYEDLAGERYETEWRLNPLIYQEDRYVYDKDISDLVDAVEHLSDDPPESAGERRHEYGAVESPTHFDDSTNGSSRREAGGGPSGAPEQKNSG